MCCNTIHLTCNVRCTDFAAAFCVFLRHSLFTLFSQATALIGGCDAAWRKCDLMRRLDNNITLLQATCQRLQLQLARFQWLFEDDVIASSAVMPNRAAVMSDLRKVSAHINNL